MPTLSPKLVPAQVDGNTALGEITLGARVTIGRTSDNDVVIDDREVSKHHAEIVAEGEAYWLRDLNSSNGTFVDGARVTSKHRLLEGQLVEMGRARYTLQLPKQEQPQGAVAILPKSPLDRTVFLAASELQELLPSRNIADMEALKKVYDRVRTAFEAVQSLLTITDLGALCEKILEVTFQLVRAENGAVLLYDEKQELVPWAHRGVASVDERIVVSRTVLEEVLRRKAAVLANDALTDSRWGGAKSVVMSGVRSLMCVPLMSGDKVFGVMQVGNSQEVGAFAASDLELINGIGVGAGLALRNAFLSKQLREEERRRESLGRFLSPVLLEKVLTSGMDLNRGGQEVEVTIMFADIRGFTTLTERSEATAVVALLNEYFDPMVEVVFRYGGVLDKFIGDAMMCVWGAPLASDKDALHAVQAAQGMQMALVSYNMTRKKRGDDPVHIGIGLASGRVVSGVIGARRRMELTVIGDAVNLASRLAGLAKAGQIMCDEETFRRAGSPDNARSLNQTMVKGKTRPVSVFEVVWASERQEDTQIIRVP